MFDKREREEGKMIDKAMTKVIPIINSRQVQGYKYIN